MSNNTLFVSFKHLVSWNLTTDKGDRASDVELQKLAQRLVKPNGEVWEEGNWWIFDWLRI
jgi:hypothetical protein